MKRRYKGEFNLSGEIHTLYRLASSPAQARRYCLFALSKILGISMHKLRGQFNGSSDNYRIVLS